jgi:hypothetical protein
MKRTLAALSGAGLASLLSVGAYAANPETVVVEVTFVDPIDIVENNPLQFGLVDTSFANADTITVGTDGSVTDSGAFSVGGTQAAANLSVTAATATPITIVVDNITNNTDYSLSAFQCSYDGGADTACDGAGMNTTSSTTATAPLLIGATITGNGGNNATPGAQPGSFDVTITYQ